MSVRIHQLSKDLGMENKELIELLKSRGYEVKSASSTVDNISAEALREEFAAQAPQPAEPEPEAPVAPKLPEGAFVKSAADIDREHQEKSVAEEAEKAAKAPKAAKGGKGARRKSNDKENKSKPAGEDDLDEDEQEMLESDSAESSHLSLDSSHSAG